MGHISVDTETIEMAESRTYKEAGSDELRSRFLRFRKEVFGRLVTRNRAKYGAFLRFLGLYKYVSLSLQKGHLLESYYLYMRTIDDIVDGDAPLPSGYMNSIEYLEERIRCVGTSVTPNDPLGWVYLYCLHLAERRKITLSEETQDILHALLFDARRRGTSTVFSRQELSDHYFLLDIRGTIRAALKIFGENSDQYMLLEPLGRASRLFFDLQDYHDDLKAGIVNVPVEDISSYGLSPFGGDYDKRLTRWFHDQAAAGLMLLDEHRRNLKHIQLTRLTGIILAVVYEAPARRYFEALHSKVSNE